MAFRSYFGLVCAVLLLWPGSGSARSVREFLLGPPKATPPASIPQTSQKQAQRAFLQQIRRSDPNRQTIEKAVFNERNELGLVLSRRVAMDAVPPLMKATLGQMARAFPRRDLTVVAYAPAIPPLKIGTARLNARTRVMTYEPARKMK